MECPSCGAHPALYWTGPCRCSQEEKDAAYARLPPLPAIPGWDEAIAAGKARAEERAKAKEKEQEGIALLHEAAKLVAADLHDLFLEMSDPNRFPG